MKLLICTQAVDSTDPILGFFIRWIEEFAKHCEEVVVLAQRVGPYKLPPNVRVFSLGKEEGLSRPQQILRFYRLIVQQQSHYDAVWVHMSPEYIIAGGALWRMWGKKIMLWYTHKDVSARLRAAVYFADKVATASKESFRLPSSKVYVFGHGIDTEVFKPAIPIPGVGIRIITVGRISPTKRLLDFIYMLDELYASEENFEATIVGRPMTAAELTYKKELEHQITLRPYASRVKLVGNVLHTELPAVLSKADMFVNFSETGSMDKAVLEALAVELPVITTNEAFRAMLQPYGLWIPTIDPKVVARALVAFLARPDASSILLKLRTEVRERHSLSKLIPAMLKELA